jgi:hypothetical protein
VGDVGENGHANGHLLFVWSTSGYELHERDGEVPAAGSEVQAGERRFRVLKVAPSPLPGDRRACAYLQPV